MSGDSSTDGRGDDQSRMSAGSSTAPAKLNLSDELLKQEQSAIAGVMTATILKLRAELNKCAGREQMQSDVDAELSELTWNLFKKAYEVAEEEAKKISDANDSARSLGEPKVTPSLEDEHAASRGRLVAAESSGDSGFSKLSEQFDEVEFNKIKAVPTSEHSVEYRTFLEFNRRPDIQRILHGLFYKLKFNSHYVVMRESKGQIPVSNRTNSPGYNRGYDFVMSSMDRWLKEKFADYPYLLVECCRKRSPFVEDIVGFTRSSHFTCAGVLGKQEKCKRMHRDFVDCSNDHQWETTPVPDADDVKLVGSIEWDHLFAKKNIATFAHDSYRDFVVSAEVEEATKLAWVVEEAQEAATKLEKLAEEAQEVATELLQIAEETRVEATDLMQLAEETREAAPEEAAEIEHVANTRMKNAGKVKKLAEKATNSSNEIATEARKAVEKAQESKRRAEEAAEKAGTDAVAMATMFFNFVRHLLYSTRDSPEGWPANCYPRCKGKGKDAGCNTVSTHDELFFGWKPPEGAA